MKSMKKLVLAGLILLASVMVLVGCKNDSVPETPKYTVTFDKNAEDATGEMTPQTFTQGEKKELTANAFERPTWTFSGWSTNKEAATPEYGNQAQFSATKDTTLYAIWTDNGTVTPVTFTSQDGTKFYYGEMVTVTLATATEGATIYYQLGEGKWEIYEKPFTVSSETVVTAYATKDGLKDSEKTNSNYLRQLISITVTPPSRTVYSVGEQFDPTGMVVTATYDDGEPREVTGWTTDFAKVTSVKGVNKEVTVSYTEGDNTETATFTVDVVDPSVPTILTSYISPNHTDDSWTYVAFGEWPQSEAIGVSPTKVEQHPEGLFNEKYYSDSNGNYVKEGDKYYKVEPIVWRVLTENYLVPDENGQPVESGNSLLLAEKILTGGIPYYENTSSRKIGSATVYANNYKYSTIRAWLNGKVESDDTQEKNKAYEGTGFLQTAFTPDAQGLIVETTVDNSAASTIDAGQKLEEATKYACDDTGDKIFLLSEQEATTKEYGFGEYSAFGQGNTRIRVTTDYAKATGAYQDGTTGYGGWWWLRSPYLNVNSARRIYADGYAFNYNIVNVMKLGVVPALSISMNGN